MENLYCRFCAELKSSEKLLNLQDDLGKYEALTLKLNILNADCVSFSSDDILPKTVCLVCYESLSKACEFLENLKRAQELLSIIFRDNDGKRGVSDDDRADDYDELLADNDGVIKEEEKPDTYPQDEGIEVKQELKQEVEDQTNYNEVLNVEDILDAAMCNVPVTSNITLYAKEVSDLSKKNSKTWKNYPWLCAYCNIEFMDIESLRSHCKAVHGKCAAYSCADCKVGKKDSFTSFIKHVRKHRKYLRHLCYYCDHMLDKSEDLTSHVKEHFHGTQVACVFCGEIFKNEESLKVHLQDYNWAKKKRKPRRKPGTPITVEDLTCPLCKKVYKNPNSLRDHMKLHTIDRKRNYTCDRCGKMFYNKGTLTSHILAHDNIRPHVCRICNKSFLYPNMLRRHVEVHSGVKPFSCEQCGRCFRLQYQLNAHKIIHTDSMPYVCTYCSKAFRFKQILKNHERQHTGAKPYSCVYCGMEFTNWSNFNKHMKRRHDTDTAKKKITPEGVFPVNPQTGRIMQIEDPVATEEWKSKIMVPAKRGKKKVIKLETE